LPLDDLRIESEISPTSVARATTTTLFSLGAKTESELLLTYGIAISRGDLDEMESWRIAIKELRRSGLLQPFVPITPSIAAIRFAELVEL
jgi:hypothetical protein